jgi:hypothetical protein
MSKIRIILSVCLISFICWACAPSDRQEPTLKTLEILTIAKNDSIKNIIKAFESLQYFRLRIILNGISSKELGEDAWGNTKQWVEFVEKDPFIVPVASIGVMGSDTTYNLFPKIKVSPSLDRSRPSKIFVPKMTTYLRTYKLPAELAKPYRPLESFFNSEDLSDSVFVFDDSPQHPDSLVVLNKKYKVYATASEITPKMYDLASKHKNASVVILYNLTPSKEKKPDPTGKVVDPAPPKSGQQKTKNPDPKQPPRATKDPKGPEMRPMITEILGDVEKDEARRALEVLKSALSYARAEDIQLSERGSRDCLTMFNPGSNVLVTRLSNREQRTYSIQAFINQVKLIKNPFEISEVTATSSSGNIKFTYMRVVMQ